MPSIYDIVTERILESLEKGVIPWKKDWSAAAVSWSTGKGYRGINALLIDRPGEYITFNQIQANGGQIKKGARSEIVVLYKPVVYGAIGEDEDGEPIGGQVYIKPIRYYRVFNLADVEGIAPRWTKEHAVIEPLEEAERVAADYISRSGVTLHHEPGNRAYYRPSTDSITMPEMKQFNTQAGYYGTLFHEMTHSTGHPKRLNRKDGELVAAFGSEKYAREELVAEIGSAMVYSTVGLGAQPVIDNSAAYIASWSKAIKDDPKMIVTASNAAQRAADLILNVKPETPAAAEN